MSDQPLGAARSRTHVEVGYIDALPPSNCRRSDPARPGKASSLGFHLRWEGHRPRRRWRSRSCRASRPTWTRSYRQGNPSAGRSHCRRQRLRPRFDEFLRGLGGADYRQTSLSCRQLSWLVCFTVSSRMMRTHSAMRPVSSVWQRVRSRSSRRMSLALRSPCRKGAGTSAMLAGAGAGRCSRSPRARLIIPLISIMVQPPTKIWMASSKRDAAARRDPVRCRVGPHLAYARRRC